MNFSLKPEYIQYRRYFANIKKLYQQKKVRVYTEIILSILTTSFFIFFAIKPTLVTITSLIKETKDKKIVAQKLDEKINALNTAQEKYFNVQKDLYLVDQALPKNPQLSLFVKQLEFLTLKSNVSINDIQYSPVTLIGGNIEENKLKSVDFKITVEGNYQELKNFLSSLNNLRRITNIEGFAFKTKTDSEKLNLSIFGKIFFLEEK